MSSNARITSYPTDVIRHVQPSIIKSQLPANNNAESKDINTTNMNSSAVATSVAPAEQIQVAIPNNPSAAYEEAKSPASNRYNGTNNIFTRGPGTNSKRGTCLIIYTGGTIGMKRNLNGNLAPTSGYLEQTLRDLPEIKHPDVPNYDLLEWASPVDSSDFTPQLWVALALQIENNYYDYDG
jgi:L-asparaginase/Glu-tRNA(Gln) amidotransferase subunit D